MTKKQETISRDAKSDRDVFTGIRTVGALAPHLDKVLEVDDILMVIVIDKKKQKHLRISYPTQTLARHGGREDLPQVEYDQKGCGWWTDCVNGGGDQPRLKKWCKYPNPDCSDKHEEYDLGPCEL